jgi:hypothetical protein
MMDEVWSAGISLCEKTAEIAQGVEKAQTYFAPRQSASPRLPPNVHFATERSSAQEAGGISGTVYLIQSERTVE